jgi:hypothetical protein
MLREHFSSSLDQVLAKSLRWVEGRPVWIRPAFYGVALLFGFMIWRGGLVIMPVLIVYFLAKDPSFLVHRLLPALFFFVPAAGFLGGLLYGTSEPLLRPLGRVGKVIRLVLGVFVYAVLLTFVIVPLMDPKQTASWSSSEDWIIAGGIGLLAGLVLGIQAVFGGSDKARGHSGDAGAA